MLFVLGLLVGAPIGVAIMAWVRAGVHEQLERQLRQREIEVRELRGKLGLR